MPMKCRKTQKKLLHFGGRHVAGPTGYFRAICCFVCWEGNRSRFAIVSILGCSGKPGRCPREAPGGEAGGPGTRGPGEAEAKVYVVLGGPGGRCRALIKAWVRGARPAWRSRGGRLCGGLCCSCLSRSLFGCRTVKRQNPRNVFRYLQPSTNCQVLGGGWNRVGGLKPPPLFLFCFWL